MNFCMKGLFCFAKALPFVFIVLLVGWSYYAYVVAMCLSSIPSVNVAEKVSFLVFYHILFVMFVWSYLQTAFAKPVLPPDEYKLSAVEWARIEATVRSPDGLSQRRDYLTKLVSERGLPVYTRGADNSIRLCDVCRIIKPDRAHHCSTCQACLLKMDHHCPWVNNCVGLHNYKYFVLFLLYGSLYCFYVGGTSTKYFINFWTEGVSDYQAYRFHVLFVFFAAWMFSISLFGLGGYHLYLILQNQTTLESFRAPVMAGGDGPDKRAFYVGAGRNFCQVFGDRCFLWCLPLPTWQQDGLNWERRVASSSPSHQRYAAMEDGGDSCSPSALKEQRVNLVSSAEAINRDNSWQEIASECR